MWLSTRLLVSMWKAQGFLSRTTQGKAMLVSGLQPVALRWKGAPEVVIASSYVTLGNSLLCYLWWCQWPAFRQPRNHFGVLCAQLSASEHLSTVSLSNGFV